MLDLRIVAEGRSFTLDQAVAHLGEQRAFSEIGRLIEAMIGKLDDLAGEPDLEDDDPAGDPLDMLGEHPTDDGRELAPTWPAYGDDQTSGPLNVAAAQRAYALALYPHASNGRT